MRIAIIGRTRMLYNAIEYLKKDGHEIVVIGTCKSADEYDIKEEDFEQKANELGVPFFCDVNINSSSIIEMLQNAKADIAISVNWLTIIKEEVLNIFPCGVLNAHCGDLPRYKGNACPNWAIIKGEKEFAISIHYMTEELDSGDIVIKQYYPITIETTITDVYCIAEREVPLLFCKAINTIQSGNKGTSQSDNPKDMLRCYPRIPTDSIIDWNWSCEEIAKVVKASSFPFEGAYTFYGNIKVHIMSCAKKEYECPCYVYPGQVIVVNKNSGEIEVAASDGVIVIRKIVIDGEEFVAAEKIKSTRIRFNYCLQEEIYRLNKRIDELERIFKGLE